MTVAEIISDLDDHGFTDTTEGRKLEIINETIWDACGREPWRFLEKSVDLNFDGTSPTPTDVPSDFRGVFKIFWKADGHRIKHWREDDFIETFGANLTLAGAPWIFYFEGTTLKFYPVPPSGADQATMKYLHWPAEVNAASGESAIPIPPRYHRGVIVNGSLYKLYLMEDDPEMSGHFERLYEKTLTNMRDDVWMVQYDQPDYIHIIDVDDLPDDF